MLVSWIATASIYSFAFYPMLYTNMWFIPAWLMGTFAFIVGLFSVYSPSDKRRNSTMNIWVAVLILFAITNLIAGIYFVKFLSDDNEVTRGCMDEAVKAGGSLAADAAKKLGYKGNAKRHEALSAAGDRLKVFAESAAHRILYEHLPYPLSAFYFLHWQIGVSAMVFAVIPTIMAFWAVYQGLGIRNFFATNPAAYKNSKVADGPLWDDDSEFHESHSEVSFDSSSESPHDHEAKRPLKTRPEYSYTQSPRQAAPKPNNVVRVNPGTAKVIAGRNVVV